jgi:hypothetical protein
MLTLSRDNVTLRSARQNPSPPGGWLGHQQHAYTRETFPGDREGLAVAFGAENTNGSGCGCATQAGSANEGHT